MKNLPPPIKLSNLPKRVVRKAKGKSNLTKDIIRDFWLTPLYKLNAWRKKKDHTLTIKIRWVVAGFLLLALWPSPTHVVYGDPKAPAIKVSIPPKAKPLPESTLTPVEPIETAPEPVAVPEPAPAPVSTYSGSGDQYLDYIISHESGGNPYAVNPIGACGLGQSLPCSKVLNACGSLDNVACQIEWVRNYCVSRYGSTYDAYLFWTAHSWY